MWLWPESSVSTNVKVAPRLAIGMDVFELRMYPWYVSDSSNIVSERCRRAAGFTRR